MKQQELQNLLAEMTIEEKIGQLTQVSGFLLVGDEGELTGPMEEMGVPMELRNTTGSVLGSSGANEVKEIIDNLTLEFPVKTGENGRVFGSVSTKQIEDYLKKEHDIIVDKRKFKPNKSLTNLGLNRIKITLFPKVVAELKVRLVEKS